MIRHGEPPFLECSSRGDKRFSAFYARIKAEGNKTIEQLYQGYKIIYIDGKPTSGLSIKEAKGKRASNSGQAALFYSRLWDKYIEENPELLSVLQQASGLSDIFGQEGHCCQATELWRIRCASSNKGPSTGNTPPP